MISVCMATYNGEKHIKEQIDSILSQLNENDELIISDDGSIDATCDIVQKYNDKRIKLCYNNGIHGFRYNFENALNQAKGEYVFLSDQDDVWMDNKVNIIVSILNEYDLVVHNSMVVDDNLHLIHPSFFQLNGCNKSLLSNIVKTSFYGSCMAFRRSLLSVALPLCKTASIGHDQWLGFTALLTGRVCFLDEPLIKYRRLCTSITRIGSFWTRSNRSLYKKIYSRLEMLFAISKFWLKYKWAEYSSQLNSI